MQSQERYEAETTSHEVGAEQAGAEDRGEPTAEAGADSSDLWLQTQSQLESGVNWFNWIAALSLINVVIFLLGSDRTFVIGLGITQLISGIAMAIAQQDAAIEWIAKGVALGMSLGVAGVFAGFAMLGKRRHVWAIAMGMGLYFVDGMLFLLFSDWMSVGFHAFALFCLWGGLSAARTLNGWERQLGAAGEL